MALSLGSVARAGTIYDNLPPAVPSAGMDPISTFGPLADSFSNGAAATLVDLKLLLNVDIPTDGGTVTVSLLSSDESTSPPTPGSVIATLGTINDSSLSTSLSVVDISGLSVALAANTRYWIELSQPNGSANWSFAGDASGVGTAGEFFFNQNGPFPNSEGPYQMQINVASGTIPEPSAVVLGMIGIGGLFILRRRVVR
jgi:hypothetical protein